MARTLVVIPNYNGCRWLGPCLTSLARQADQDFDVVVVDNGSSDGSLAFLTERFPQAQVIRNHRNLGFATATNQGIRAFESRFVVTLNNDTTVSEGWLAALVSAAESAPDIGMCASKMLFAHDPKTINSAGLCVDRLGIAWDRLGGHHDQTEVSAPTEVFGPSGGAALYRREMLDQIGLFDEDFFAYLEDVDLAWRARYSGWRCLYVSQARVLHHHSATARRRSAFKSYHLGRNKVWTVLKNYPFRRLWAYVPLMIFYDMLAIAYASVVRRDLHTLRGRIAGWAQTRTMLSKRRQLGGDVANVLGGLTPVPMPWTSLGNQTYHSHLSGTKAP